MESGSKIFKKYSFSTKAAVIKINKILAILSDNSFTMHEIANQIHATFDHTRYYMKYLISEKKIYISSWQIDESSGRRLCRPCYRTGNRPDKPRPEKLTHYEKCLRYREKLAKDFDRLDKANIRRRLKRSVIKPDWTATWLMNNG
jgi:hypothetical protein